jgi:phage terminase Nu1 subunit (DNA packaging protein)
MKSQRIDEKGVTGTRLAEIFGVNRKTIRRWDVDGMPRPADLRRDGYDLPARIQWRIAELEAKHAAELEEANSVSDRLFFNNGGSSPALERYRNARAKMAELQLKEKLQNVIRRDLVHDGFGIIFGQLRAASQRLRDRHGAKAGKVLDDCFVQMRREIRAHFGAAPEPDDEGDE